MQQEPAPPPIERDGRVVWSGDRSVLTALQGVLERGEPEFEIVTP